MIRGVEGLQICIPAPMDVEDKYKNSAENNGDSSFPYWTRLWPSSIALARYIRAHYDEFPGKTVLEIGAGLGLPSFIVSSYASSVKVTDHIPEAITWLNENIKRLGLANIKAENLDWTAPLKEKADIILLSDVSYDPDSFEPLSLMIDKYLDQGSKVIVALPERILSGQFYNLIKLDIVDSTTYAIEDKRVVVASLER